jgi:hypothetical protein
MTEVPLFAGYEPPPPPVPEPPLSADRRRTLRQAADVARGVHPLTRGRLHPEASREASKDDPRGLPYTCGSCRFREVIPHHSRAFPKCTFGVTSETRYWTDSPRISASAATDVRAWWPACVDYTPGDPALSPDAARCLPTDHRQTESEDE